MTERQQYYAATQKEYQGYAYTYRCYMPGNIFVPSCFFVIEKIFFMYSNVRAVLGVFLGTDRKREQSLRRRQGTSRLILYCVLTAMTTEQQQYYAATQYQGYAYTYRCYMPGNIFVLVPSCFFVVFSNARIEEIFFMYSNVRAVLGVFLGTDRKREQSLRRRQGTSRLIIYC